MKFFNKTTISIGWMLLLVFLAVIHLMGKSLTPFQPVLVGWLVLTIFHWWHIRRASGNSAIKVVERKPK